MKAPLGWTPIVSNCANPWCREAYRSRTGEFFLFEEDHPGAWGVARTNSTRAVWLCERCRHRFTVTYDLDEKAVALVPLDQASAA